MILSVANEHLSHPTSGIETN